MIFNLVNITNLILILGTSFFYYNPEIRYYVYKNYIYSLFELFYQIINNTNDLEEMMEQNCADDSLNTNTIEQITEKYEDKYLKDIRKMNKEFVFTDAENEEKMVKYISFLSILKKKYYEKVSDCKNKILEIESKMVRAQKQKTQLADDEYYYEYEPDEDDEDYYYEKDEETYDIEFLTEQLNEYQSKLKKYYELLQTSSGEEVLKKKAQEEAEKYIINNRWNELKHNFIIEKTPVGNVLMVYNNDKETFQYYSDNNIPYRYLETVGRKYVKQFNCRLIFVDMEEELKRAEEKWLKENEEKTNTTRNQDITNENMIKDNDNKNNAHVNNINNINNNQPKKSVFAKFKSYNKEAGTGHVNTAVPPKNSIPNNKLTAAQENEKILLKEKANRYTYEGKFANFSFLKKIERKLVDKKYSMSFSDFKNLKIC